MGRLDNLYCFYDHTGDKELAASLGFDPEMKFEHGQETFVGEVTNGDAVISVYVDAWPAQFWRFRVSTGYGKKFRVRTGSGALSEYWPSVMMISEDMLVVEEE